LGILKTEATKKESAVVVLQEKNRDIQKQRESLEAKAESRRMCSQALLSTSEDKVLRLNEQASPLELEAKDLESELAVLKTQLEGRNGHIITLQNHIRRLDDIIKKRKLEKAGVRAFRRKGVVYFHILNLG
jgi:hypothetical protein